MIKQYTLTEFNQLAAAADKASKAYDAAKKDIVTRLKNLERVEVGDWQASLIPTSRRVPAWKEIYVQACGVEAAENVIAATEPSVSSSLKVTLRPGVIA